MNYWWMIWNIYITELRKVRFTATTANLYAATDPFLFHAVDRYSLEIRYGELKI